MIRAIQFFGLVLLNVIVAILGTAIATTAISKAIPLHSISGVLWRESFLSVVCAALIGIGMWRTWKSEAAKWTWVIPLAWFAFGFIAVGQNGVFGSLAGSSSGTGFAAPELRSFFAFTVPLIRAVSYSVGVYISAFVYPRTVSQASASSQA